MLLQVLLAVVACLLGGGRSQPSPSPSPADLAAVLDLYSPARLARVWHQEPASANTTCFRQMGIFLDDLAEAKLWALHVADASGRYSGGFLWGNGYWLGSADHCEYLEPSPPFPLGFFVIRSRLQLSGPFRELLANKTDNTQTTLIGVCLPFSCTAENSKEIFERSINSSDLEGVRSVRVEVEKSPHNHYYMSEDPVFWILISITAIVLVFASLGTGIELYDDYTLEKRKITKFAYDNYTYEIAKSPEVITASVKIPAGANNNENSEAESSERNSVNSEEIAGKPVYNRRNVWKEILLAFSLKKNFSTICERSVGEDTIPTIHGLRSLSMAWVILGHTCIIAFKYSDNMTYRSIVERDLVFQTVNKGAYSVDTFFFISGLLVSFLYFRTTAKHDISKITKATGFTSSFIEFFGLISYRFARLTTPYFFILGVVQVTMRWFHYNSVFEPPTLDHVNCPEYWWRNLLYINTLYPVQEMCMLWSWYLADDTQFYILGVILLIMAVKHFRAAATLMTVFLISSWSTTAIIAYTNNHVPNEDDPLALFDKIYDKPWTRLGPYLVGMCIGWLLFKTDCKIKMNRIVVAVGWTLSIGMILFLIYGLFGTKLHPVTAAAFSSLSHTAWALALSWIVVACSTGYGGYVSDILSSSLLYPFSRVTYCAYLVHPVVIRIVTMRMEAPLHLGAEAIVVMFTGHLILSYVLSFVVSLLFEAPVVSLLRIISPTKRKSK